MRQPRTPEPYELVVFYPKLVRHVRTVRNGITAVVFLVALTVFGSWSPWAIPLALVPAFVAWCVTAWRFPRAGSDLQLRFQLATRKGYGVEDQFRALARRLRDRGEVRELEWLLTSTIRRKGSVPNSWVDPEYYRMHVDLLTARGRTEELAALRVGAASKGTLNGPVLDDPTERAAIREALRVVWDSGTRDSHTTETYVRVLLLDQAYEEAVPVLRQLVANGWAEHRSLADALRHLGREAKADDVLAEFADIEARRARDAAQRRADQPARTEVHPVGFEHHKPSLTPPVYGGYTGGGGYSGGGG